MMNYMLSATNKTINEML